jgi:hypothetical protein
MTWGATSKEAEDTPFFEEIPRVLKNFKFTFLFCISGIATIVVLAIAAPPLWRIDSFVAIYPLGALIFGHFMLPVALNPALMRFTW